MLSQPADARDRNRPLAIHSLRTFTLVAICAFLAFSSVPAADPAARPPSLSDIVLARSALAALDADPMIGRANLLVSVVDRVAVVGGPVASNERVRRVEAIVRGVAGIIEVKNRCYVQDGSDPMLQAMAARPAPRQFLASELPGMVASPRTGLVEEYRPALGENRLAAVEPPEKSVVALRPMNPGASILLPPINPAHTTRSSLHPVSPAPAVLTSRPADVLAASEAIRRTERRFAGLSIDIANGSVVVAGTAARAADAWDLAEQLRRIPGVPRVVVGRIDVK